MAELLLPLLSLRVNDLQTGTQPVVIDLTESDDDGPAERARAPASVIDLTESDDDGPAGRLAPAPVIDLTRNDDDGTADRAPAPAPATAPPYSIMSQSRGDVQSLLLDELRHFVQEHVKIDYDGVAGPDAYLIGRLKMAVGEPHGFFVYARANQPVVAGSSSSEGVRKGDVVGLLVASADATAYAGRARVGRVYTVRVLAVHDGMLRKGVARALWTELERLIQNERVETLTLIVEGGPCLNNQASRAFYRRLGFKQPCDNQMGRDSLSVSLQYVKGRRQS